MWYCVMAAPSPPTVPEGWETALSLQLRGSRQKPYTTFTNLPPKLSSDSSPVNTQTVLRIFPNEYHLSCQFLTNLLFHCLKSMKGGLVQSCLWASFYDLSIVFVILPSTQIGFCLTNLVLCQFYCFIFTSPAVRTEGVWGEFSPLPTSSYMYGIFILTVKNVLQSLAQPCLMCVSSCPWVYWATDFFAWARSVLP